MTHKDGNDQEKSDHCQIQTNVFYDNRCVESFQANLANDDGDHFEVQKNGNDCEQGTSAGVDLKIEHKHAKQNGDAVWQREEVVVAGGPALQSDGDFDCKREVD